MKTGWLMALAVVLTAAATAGAQERERLYSTPAIPPREALERLNLQVAWQATVPTDGRRDGFVSIQHTGRQIIALTRTGVVSVFDAETGRPVWSVRVGTPYHFNWPTAFNSTSIYVASGTNLYALDRSNGAQQWKMQMPTGLAAQPLADEHQVYFYGLNGTAYAFEPRVVEIVEGPGADAPGLYDPTSPPANTIVRREMRPLPRWDQFVHNGLDLPPVQTPTKVVLAGREGLVVSVVKVSNELYPPDPTHFTLESTLQAGPGAWGNVAYFGGRDGYAYGYDVITARVLWRQLLGSGVIRTPVATDLDLFAITEREGMSRLDRETGRPLWALPRGNRVLSYNPDAERFLAANLKFVYAADRSGRLMVLDRSRGQTLSLFDVHDFVFPVTNDQTDRIYLAANNGLILCLRDRENTQPYRQRVLTELEKEAGQSPEERVREFQKRAITPVSWPDGGSMSVNRFLETIREKYRIKTLISRETYEKNGVPNPGDIQVKVLKVDKMPLDKAINTVIGSANAKAEVLKGIDFFLIIPARAGKAPPR